MSELHEECGIIGAVSRRGYSENLSQMLYMGLYTLQHRGQEAAGISVSNENIFETFKNTGTVDWVFRERSDAQARARFIIQHPEFSEQDEPTLARELADFDREHRYNPLARLGGSAGIGHVRYSTRGESGKNNVHPIEFQFRGVSASVAHNGNLVNVEELEAIIASRGGYDFGEDITTDTGRIAALIATSPQETFWEAFLETLPIIKGSFSLAILYRDAVYLAKDEFGLRPLCLGMSDDFWYVASETCALDTLNAEFFAEVDPGHALAITLDGFDLDYFTKWAPNAGYRSCAFEAIYFSHPSSLYRETLRLHVIRRNMGMLLAQEHPISHVDVVTSVPDSGNASAVGYAEALGKPFKQVIIRNHQTGRTFIQPVEEERRAHRGLKYSFIPEDIVGKNIAVVDDSIVRGNTMPYIVQKLKDFGAKQVFVLSASPAIVFSCHLGVDMPTRRELIAYTQTVEEIRREIGADYLGYFSLEGLRTVLEEAGLPPDSFCYGCMDGEYPIAIQVV